MFVALTFIGIRENNKKEEYKIVLEEKKSGGKLLVDVTKDLVSQIKYILGENDYDGIYDAFLSVIEKFGFLLKKTVLDIRNKSSQLYLYDEFGNSFSVKTGLIDGVIISTYNTSAMYIDEFTLKKYKNSNDSILYSSLDLGKYTIDALYKMLERAKYDDSFLEEAIRIKDEIKLREKEAKPYSNGPDLIY